MAYSVAQMYPGAFTPDVNFVDGKYKNSSAPGVYDGTPLDNLLFNQNLAFFDALMLEAGLTYNNSADIPSTSQLHKAMQIVREVSPRNNDWNGYLDPEHQSSLPAPNGYPGASGGGEVVYAADEEISFGIFAGSGGATVSSDSDGWIFTGSIYKLYDYTTEQLADIDVTKVPVYLKNQVGAESFIKHNGTSVIVTKVGSQLKVEIAAAIFAGSFTKLWRFFVTERVGRVVELSPDSMIIKYLSSKGFDFSPNGYHVMPSGLILQWGAFNAPAGVNAQTIVTYPVPFPNGVFVPILPIFASTTPNSDNISWGGSVSLSGTNVYTSLTSTQDVRYIVVGY